MMQRTYKMYKIMRKGVMACIVLCFSLFSICSYLYITEEHLAEAVKKTREHITNNYLDVKYNHSRVEQLYKSIRMSEDKLRSLDDDVTVVTAYFNLGNFKKGENDYYTPDIYRKWMSIFRKIVNPTVAYFDSAEFCDYFKVLRQNLLLNKTKIILVDRKDLWAFQIQNKVDEIFKQPGYPKHHPNTIVPEYTCAMHAKYELMKRSTIENPFNTKYFSWVDIGLFRHLNPTEESQFGIYLPQNFEENSVSYGEVRWKKPELIPVDVVYVNYVWVCGCFFIGRTDVMMRWTLEYMEGVEWLLRKKLMSTDQQVIFIIHNANLLKTKIHAYKNVLHYNNWFHLGYYARDSWINKTTLH